jgi:hypothetical protein
MSSRLREHDTFPSFILPAALAVPWTVSLSRRGSRVVSVADIVVRTLIKYLSEVKDAKRDISALLTETSNLNGILRKLELLARQFQDEEVPATVQTHHLHHCHMTLERLRGLLEHAYPSKHESSLRAFERRLRWPISKPETEKLVDELQRHKTTLNLALTADGMSALLHALSRQSEIREDVREIKT